KTGTCNRLGKQAVENVVLPPDVHILRIGEPTIAIGSRAIAGKEPDEVPAQLPAVEWPQEKRVHKTEHGAVRANAEGEDEHGHQREAGRLAQHANGKADVLDERLERGHRAAIPVRLAEKLHAAGRDERLTPRLLRGQAATEVVFDVHVEMALQFGVELLVARHTGEHTSHANPPDAKRSHDASPGVK